MKDVSFDADQFMKVMESAMRHYGSEDIGSDPDLEEETLPDGFWANLPVAKGRADNTLSVSACRVRILRYWIRSLLIAGVTTLCGDLQYPPPWLWETHPAVYFLHQRSRAGSVGALTVGVQPFFIIVYSFLNNF